MRTQSTYIEAPAFLGMIRSPAWLNVSLNPRCSGYLFVIDGQSRWFVHSWRRRRPHTTYTTFASPRFQGAAHLIFALRDGRSLYDVLGPEFTLLRFDPAVETDGIVAAFAQSAVPLVVLDVDADDNASPYAHKLVISRPGSTRSLARR
jgi:hypothetical protein